jgi:phosphoenolpyruvate carboxykinase (GTP)
VPISAILFGGRRSTVVPLVNEAFDWEHGVFLGSIMSSETTAAQQGAVGQLRFDPMAMLPFCGYNMADYWQHWLDVGANAPDPAKLPKIYYVNWFRRDGEGRFLWPGFGENSRVLKWVAERVNGAAGARDTAIGRLPEHGAIDIEDLPMTGTDLHELLAVDAEGWRATLPQIEAHYARFGEHLPAALAKQLESMEKRLAE